MDYGSIPIFSAMKLKMQYLGQRQAVLAQNIANVDTPGYQAKDVQAPDFSSMMKSGLSMTRTSLAHLTGQGGGQSGNAFKLMNRHPTYETNPNKNDVALEEELQQLSMNGMDYQQVTGLYTKMIGMFRTAIDQTAGS